MKKKNIFLCISRVQTHDSLERGYFVNWDLYLNKLDKGSLDDATYKISSIWPKWFWRRMCLNIFYIFYGITPLRRGFFYSWLGVTFWTNLNSEDSPPPRRRAILDPRATMKKLGRGLLDNCKYQSHWSSGFRWWCRLKQIVDDARRTTHRRTTDDGHWLMAIAHLELSA